MTKLLSLTGATLIALFCVLGLSSEASAQSKKSAAPAQKKEAAPASSAGDEKLDVSDLERRYWTPRDTEFNVVQNRTYSKVKRLGLSLSGGTVITDTYVDSFDKSVTLNYFPTERYGFEVNYTAYDGKPSKAVGDFNRAHGVQPNHNLIQRSFGANFNWVPLYAKMSFLEKRILYYDMYISPGLVYVTYNQHMRDQGNPTVNLEKEKSVLGVSVDVSQVVFLNRNLAFRLDFKNRWYKNDVLRHSTGQQDSSVVINSNSLLFGFTYFFGGGGE
jgi:outer membrane beta-barrel protein